jgi:hypothetical protein
VRFVSENINFFQPPGYDYSSKEVYGPNKSQLGLYQRLFAKNDGLVAGDF